MRIIGVATTLTLFTLFANMGSAQLNPVSDDIVIKLSPKFPGPRAEIRAEAISFSFDVRSASFSWFVNGKPASSGKGKDNITFSTGPLGSKTTIRVTAKSFDEKLFEKTFTLNVGELHLSWSASTYTPPWYKGKPLPTRGSLVKIVALPNLFSSGRRISSESLIYNWSLDEKLLKNSSGRGRDTLSITPDNSPSIPHKVKLLVSDDTKTITYEKTIEIASHEPTISFYQLLPLRGPTYQRSLSSLELNSGDEAKIIGVPFFFSINSLSLLNYLWTVGGSKIASESISPNILHYQTELGSSATQNIVLKIENPIYIFERGENIFTIYVK